MLLHAGLSGHVPQMLPSLPGTIFSPHYASAVSSSWLMSVDGGSVPQGLPAQQAQGQGALLTAAVL